jgi:hypothetical protein
LLEKTTKKEGTFRYCQNEECDYKMAADPVNSANKEETEEKVPA